jgi:colanic acid/amylovoran biosynthesis protein
MTVTGTKRKPHFLLVGHGGLFNRGCEAILQTTFRLLRGQFDDPTFTVVSFDWLNDRRWQDRWQGVTFRNVTPEKWRSPHWYPWIARHVIHLPSKNWRNIHRHLKREYKRADAVLSVGGDNYTTDYSSFPGYYLDLLRYAREQGSQDVIWAATIGPFEDPEVRPKVIDVLKDTALITARESMTVDYLASLGITQNVRAVADTAFLLEPSPSPAARSYNVDRTHDWLGIAASSMLWRYVSGDTEHDRSEVLVKFVDWAIQEFGFRVAFVPHVVDARPAAPSNRNDLLFLQQIAKRIKNPGRAVVLDASLNVAEMKHIISQGRFFVGSRTHSTISALSSGVPTISLSYSMKSRGINRDVLGNEDFVLPVDDLSLERLQEKFRRLMNREQEIRTTLQERIPIIQKKARQNATYLAELLRGKASEQRGHSREA